jgi:hypothetical protein
MKKVYLGALALAALVAPQISSAATYAYVNTAGEVMSMEAASANVALSTAPGLHVHSGVMLIDGSADQEIVGDNVSGI